MVYYKQSLELNAYRYYTNKRLKEIYWRRDMAQKIKNETVREQQNIRKQREQASNTSASKQHITKREPRKRTSSSVNAQEHKKQRRTQTHQGQKTKSNVRAIDISEYIIIKDKKGNIVHQPRKEETTKKIAKDRIKDTTNQKKQMTPVAEKRKETKQTKQARLSGREVLLASRNTLGVLIICGLILFISGSMFLGKYVLYIKEKRTLEEMKYNLTQLEKKEDSYRTLLERLKDDPKYLKDIAREKYYLSEEDELIFKYNEKEKGEKVQVKKDVSEDLPKDGGE